MKVSEKIFVILYLTICVLVLATKFDVLGLNIIGGNEDDLNAGKARDLRAKVRYHFAKANEAMDKMFEAEGTNDVELYEIQLAKMRREDQKLIDSSREYEYIRDYLEAKIWQGRIQIDNFDKLYEKGTLDSIVDHLLFKVHH